MSIEATYRTAIVVPQTQRTAHGGNFKHTPCGDLLRRAIDKVAADQGGEIAESWLDNEGRQHPAAMALRTPGFSRGIGVDVESDGRVVFRYDAFGTGAEAGKRLAEEVTQVYAVLAVRRAQQEHGFQTQVEEHRSSDGRRQIVVKGVMA